MSETGFPDTVGFIRYTKPPCPGAPVPVSECVREGERERGMFQYKHYMCGQGEGLGYSAGYVVERWSVGEGRESENEEEIYKSGYVLYVMYYDPDEGPPASPLISVA